MTETNTSPSTDELVLYWTKVSTIATLTGLVLIILTAATLVSDHIRRVRSTDPGRFATDRKEMGYFWMEKLSIWSAFWGRTTGPLQITTIRGLIEAGDAYLWTSAALDQLLQHHGNFSWIPLYNMIFNHIARLSPAVLKEEMKNPSIGEFLRRAKQDSSSPPLGNDSPDFKPPLFSCVRRLDTSISGNNDLEETSTLYKPKPKGLTNLNSAWMMKRGPCLEASREELAALALILGTQLVVNDYTQNIRGVGPFGIGLDVIQDNEVWKLELTHGSRIARHAPSRGSGYSILFAKHLAFGSLPFADSRYWIRSVYVNAEVLKTIRKGRCVKDGKSFGGHPLQILRSLPGAKQIDAYYHDGDPIKHEVPENETKFVGSILQSNGKPVEFSTPKLMVRANWCRAVVGIAFGGLVPQCSGHLAEAVAFTIGGTLGECVNELELLINKLHSCDKGTNAFGDYVTERCKALNSVDQVHYATPSRYDTQEAASVFARYMNLLEVMATRCRPRAGPPPQAAPGDVIESIFEESYALIHKVYVAAVGKERGNTLLDLSLLEENLGQSLRSLTLPLGEHKPPELSIEDCALVVRCILAVWASQVPRPENPDSTDNPEVPTQPRIKGSAALIDLPQIMAFA